MLIFSTFSAYILVWWLDGKEYIEGNFFDELLNTLWQWYQAIALMDVPGIPIRWVMRLIAYYDQTEAFDATNKIYLGMFIYLMFPYIYGICNLFSVFNFLLVPILGFIFALDPWLFVEDNGEDFDLLNGEYTPKAGLPSLLVEFNDMYAILYGRLGYIYNDWVPKMSIWTFVMTYVVSTAILSGEIYGVLIMLPWSI
mgnify:CR=1 FL=1